MLYKRVHAGVPTMSYGVLQLVTFLVTFVLDMLITELAQCVDAACQWITAFTVLACFCNLFTCCIWKPAVTENTARSIDVIKHG